MKKVAAPGLENRRLTAVGTCRAYHVTPLYPQKLALTSPTGGGRSVGIVRVRTKATEFSLDRKLIVFTFSAPLLKQYICKCNKGKGKVHPSTGHEGPEGE